VFFCAGIDPLLPQLHRKLVDQVPVTRELDIYQRSSV
jgi:hypothetical protein